VKKVFIFIVIGFVLIQFVPVEKTNPPINLDHDVKADQEVMTLLKNSCFDCHSNETKWPYYSSIAPVSFFVASHVHDARKALNFSEWTQIKSERKVDRLKRAIKTVNNEMMALPSYVYAHENAKLTRSQKDTLINWFKAELEKEGVTYSTLR
jgi:hypothetical protein